MLQVWTRKNQEVTIWHCFSTGSDTGKQIEPDVRISREYIKELET